jgi:hypothetical protein
MKSIIIILLLIILTVVIISCTKTSNYNDDDYWIVQANKGNLILPPKGDYKGMYGDTLDLINKGVPVKEAMKTSLTKNKDATRRKLHREITVLLRYLSLDERDPELVKYILSALVQLSSEDRHKLYDIVTYPEKYLPENCENDDEYVNRFIDFYATYYSEIQTPSEHIKIYGKTDTWLKNIPRNRGNRANKIAAYFWMVFKVILLTPELFACKVIIEPEKYISVKNELSTLILYSFNIDKKHLYNINVYKNIDAKH